MYSEQASVLPHVVAFNEPVLGSLAAEGVTCLWICLGPPCIRRRGLWNGGAVH